MTDSEVIPLLHQLDRPTFFTLDVDFYDRRLCHLGYCLVHLDVDEEKAGKFIRRVLRHRELNTRSKRMGCVIRVSPIGLARWRVHYKREEHFPWR
jgi:hypothetical protein